MVNPQPTSLVRAAYILRYYVLKICGGHQQQTDAHGMVSLGPEAMVRSKQPIVYTESAVKVGGEVSKGTAST